jgi:hypothetical protein
MLGRASDLSKPWLVYLEGELAGVSMYVEEGWWLG